mmetsp:Transcript_17733/g.22372  ORF Transcript_17733/g.22372 Transcript_17733/m.22372 type:complete len:364 (-) Transcript_17733:246-1337(-)
MMKTILLIFSVAIYFGQSVLAFVPTDHSISNLKINQISPCQPFLYKQENEFKSRVSMPLQGETENSSLASNALSLARTITQNPLYTIGAQGAVVLVLLAGIDCGWSGDWSRYGFVSAEQEGIARSLITSVGIFHIVFCAPIAVVSTWQRQQPILPALMKVLLVGGLALGQVLFQPSDKAIKFPWIPASSGEEPIEWAEKGSIPQFISQLSQSGAVASFKQAIADAVAGDYDKEAINAQLDKAIQGNAAVMFSWQTCPFCKKAKQLLIEDIGATVTVIELDEDKKVGNALRAELGKRTGRTSVPSIWIGGEYVGGCNDGPGIIPLEEEGKLRPMLEASGALKVVETPAPKKTSPFSFLDSFFQN